MYVNAAAGNLSRDIDVTYTVTLYPDSSTVTVGNSNTMSIYPCGYEINFTPHSVNGVTDSYSGYLTPRSNGQTSFTLSEKEGIAYYSCPLGWDINPTFPLSSFDNSFKYVAFSCNNFSCTSSVGSFNDVNFTYKNEDVINTHYVNKGSIYFSDSGNNYLAPTIHCSGNFNYALMSNSARADLANPITFTVNVKFHIHIIDVANSVVANNSPTFNDVQANELQQQNNDLQTQGNTLQQQNNTISQDTNTVTHDTNNKVTSFFGAFWDNLLHIFVPESGFFQQWFSDLNSFMSQKLGFLWSPFDFVISFLNGIYSSSGGTSPGIVFPGLTWIDGTVIIPQQTFNFNNIGGESFSDLRDLIYFSTDVILLGAVVHQFYQKIKIVFEGGSD